MKEKIIFVLLVHQVPWPFSSPVLLHGPVRAEFLPGFHANYRMSVVGSFSSRAPATPISFFEGNGYHRPISCYFYGSSLTSPGYKCNGFSIAALPPPLDGVIQPLRENSFHLPKVAPRAVAEGGGGARLFPARARKDVRTRW